MNGREPRSAFIVGAPRSGTTLLRLMLDAHPHLSAGPETGFLPNLEPILGQRWSHLALYGFDRVYWQHKIARFFASFQEEYARRRGKRRWIAKTPQYTPHLDFILTIFPDAQLIHLIRDGRDVVTSYQERWGCVRGLRGIREWRWFVTAARQVGKRLPADQYYELRYEDLVADPEVAMRGVLVYLQEPWDARVLHYMDEPHDVQPLYIDLTGAHHRRNDRPVDVYDGRVGVWRRKLNPLLLLALYAWAGALLKELGYS